jgi:hypothetical protein
MRPASLRGGVAGALATVVMTLEEQLDQRLLDCSYDDIAILGKLVTRDGHWRPIGVAWHTQNGAILGIAYARIKRFLPGPPVLRGLLLGLVEHVATWPLVALVDRYHPARGEMPKLLGNRRAFAQATIRHAVFGVVLGLVEDALDEGNRPDLEVVHG